MLPFPDLLSFLLTEAPVACCLKTNVMSDEVTTSHYDLVFQNALFELMGNQGLRINNLTNTYINSIRKCIKLFKST